MRALVCRSRYGTEARTVSGGVFGVAVLLASICVAPAQERAFVAAGAELVIFELDSRREIKRIPLMAPPRDLAIGDDGSTAFVVDSVHLTAVDLQTATVRKAILPRAFGAVGDRIVLAPRSDRLFLTAHYHHGGKPKIHTVDPKTLRFLDEISLPIPVDGEEYVVAALVPDGNWRRLFAVVLVDPNGREDLPPYICEVDLESNAVSTRPLLAVSGGAFPTASDEFLHGGTRSAFAAEQGVLYLQADGPIVAVDVSAGRVIERIDAPWMSNLVVDPSGLYIFGWSYGAPFSSRWPTLSAVDVRTGTVSEVMRSEAGRRAFGVLPESGKLVVAAAAAQSDGEVKWPNAVLLPLRATDGGGTTLVFGPRPPAPEVPALSPAQMPAPRSVSGGSYRGFAINGAASLMVEFDTDTGAISRRRTGVYLADVRTAIVDPELRAIHLVRDSEVALAYLQSLDVVGVARPEDTGLFGEYFADPSDSEVVRFGPTTASARSPSGDVSYVSGAARRAWYELDVVDTTSRLRVRSIPLPGSAHDIAVGVDGAHVFVATGGAVVVIDAVELDQVMVVPADRRAQVLALSPDGRTVLVAGGSSAASDRSDPVAPTLWALDAQSLRPLATAVRLAERGAALEIALTPDGRRAIVAVEDGGAVLVDLVEHRVLGTLLLGRASVAVAIDPGTWRPPPLPTPRVLPAPDELHACLIAVSTGGSEGQGAQVSVIDPSRHEIIATVDLEAVGAQLATASEFVAATADPVAGQLMATFSNGTKLPSHLVGIDLSTGSVTQRMDIGVAAHQLAVFGAEPTALVYDRRGSRATLSVIDLRRTQELAELEILFPDGPIVLSADAKRAYVRRDWTVERSHPFPLRNVVLTAIDLADRRVLFDRPLAGRAGELAAMADGSLWLDGAEDTVEVLDGTSGDLLAEIAIPVASWAEYSLAERGLAVSADGRFAYRVSGGVPGLVSVLDGARRTVVAQFEVGVALRNPVVSPDGRTLYGISAPGTLTAIRLADGSVAGEIHVGGHVRALMSATTAMPCQTAGGNAPEDFEIVPQSLQWPRLEIDSMATTPGATIPVAVRLTTAGREIVGVELEMRMSAPLRLAVDGTGSPMCRTSTDDGKFIVAVAFPRGCGEGLACTGLKALVLPPFGDLTPISDGAVLFTCDVQTASDAPAGIHRVRLLHVGASDGEGNELSMLGFGGAIEVSGGAFGVVPDDRGRDLPAPGVSEEQIDTHAPVDTQPLSTPTLMPTATMIPVDTASPALDEGDADSRAALLTGPSGGSGCQIATSTSPLAPALWAVTLALLCLRREKGGDRRSRK